MDVYRSQAGYGIAGPAAVVVDGGRVAWAGPATDVGVLPAGTTTHDVGGVWLAPAFVDAHVHLSHTGLALTALDLAATTSLSEALDLVRARATAAGGRPLLGHGWDETRWPERRRPTAAELDRAAFGGVVYLARADFHSAVVSSALLAAVPAAAATAGYEGEGFVTEEAHHLVRRAAHAGFTSADVTAQQEAALRTAARLGLGCLYECGGPEIAGEADFVSALRPRPQSPRVVGWWGELDAVDRAVELGAIGAGGDLFADGAIGSRTAALRTDYADAPGRGRAFLTATDVARHVTACTTAGVPAGFHAIGDAALDAVVGGFVAAAEQAGPRWRTDLGHRVEHVELLDPAHIPTLARLGVAASVQPVFDGWWGGPTGLYADRLGERWQGMNPFAALAAGGVRLHLGSDSPVTPLDPWGAVRAAVRHRTPGSGLSPTAAFAAHTDRPTLTAGTTLAGWRWTEPLPVDGSLPSLDQPDPDCALLLVDGHPVPLG